MSGHTYTHTYIHPHIHTHTHTYTHTYTHDNYSNPRCAHAHRGLITPHNLDRIVVVDFGTKTSIELLIRSTLLLVTPDSILDFPTGLHVL